MQIINSAKALFSEHKVGLAVILSYLAVALFMFYPITLHIFSNVPGNNENTYFGLWSLWFVPYSLFTLYANPFATQLLYYPIGSSFPAFSLAPLLSILSMPLQIFGMPFAFNSLFFLGIAFAGLCTFLLAKEFGVDNYAAWLAGFIFAFAPFHVAKAFAHTTWFAIGFLPLFLLLVLRTIKSRKWQYGLWAGLAFSALGLSSGADLTIVALLAACSMIAYSAWKKPSSIFTIELDKPFSVMLVAMLISLLPWFASMSAGVPASNVTIPYQAYSINTLSLFIPSFMNGFLNGAAGFYASAFSYVPLDKVGYPGYIAIILAIVGVALGKEKEKRMWLALGVASMIMAFGPRLQFGASSIMPLPYALFEFIPVLNLALPSSFFAFTILALAMLAAMGFKPLCEELKKREKTLFIILIVFMLVEYWGMPFSATSSFSVNASIPLAYKELGQIQSNFSVLILPALANPSSPIPQLYSSQAAYFQSAFKRNLVGGFVPNLNSTQQLALENVPFVVAASYLQRGQGMVYSSPLIENYTDLGLLWLAVYNVGFVGVTRQAYNYSQQQQLLSYLTNTFGPAVYQDNSTTVFSTQQAITASVGNNIIAYTAATWTPGWAICGDSSTCNNIFQTLWWGNNPRGIIVYVPDKFQDKTTNVSFGAASTENGKLRIFMNNETYPVQTIKLNSSYVVHTFDVNFTTRINSMVFAFTADNSTQIQNFGIDNVSIAVK